MKKEDYVKRLISASGHSVKSFAESISLPYSTLLSMLNRGLGGASVQNVIKVCKGLSITVEDLQRVDGAADAPVPFYVSEYEKQLLIRFREKPQMKPAIDAIFSLDESV